MRSKLLQVANVPVSNFLNVDGKLTFCSFVRLEKILSVPVPVMPSPITRFST